MRLVTALILAFCIQQNGVLGNENTTAESLSGEPFDIAQLIKKMFLTEKHMELPLNHFDLFDNRTWNMRYLIYDKHYKKGGPLFIEVGGEWTIDGIATIMGSMAELAQEHNGMMIETEHRFYGESLPFGEDFSAKNLEFLQMEQALEDLAYFIDHYKQENPDLKDAKVIIHGCSYPGMLVTWLRLRFPKLVDIAYASSAPLGVGLDYPEYFEVVNDVYANVSESCIDTIRIGFNQTTELMKTEEGRERVRRAFKDWTCGDVNEMNSVEILSKTLLVLNIMHDPSQYEEIGCLVMSMDSDDDEAFERLAKFVTFKSKHIASCSDSESSPQDERNSIAWAYQTCTEMGTFLTLNRKNSHHPFQMDLTVDESVEECSKQFDGVTEHVLRTGIERVTRRYGGTKPKVSKVITVQGTHDPWKHLATLEDYNDEAPVWMMDGSHCADVTKREDDSENVINTRIKVKKLITKWIKEIS